MRYPPIRSELLLLLSVTTLLLVAIFAPSVVQPPDAHDFADQRLLWGLPHAIDVLSNLAFALAGVAGFAVLRRVPAASLTAVERGCAGLFFAGLLLTAAASGWYHLHPDDLGLAIDRLAMSTAFAGLLGLLAACGISLRAGRQLAIAILLAGPASVLVWYGTGNVLPWALLQFGGIPLLLAMVVAGPRAGRLPVRWSLVLLAYAVAKWFELNDHALYLASGELLAGHSLKHLAAAVAAWPVITALAGLGRRQNALQAAGAAA